MISSFHVFGVRVKNWFNFCDDSIIGSKDTES